MARQKFDGRRKANRSAKVSSNRPKTYSSYGKSATHNILLRKSSGKQKRNLEYPYLLFIVISTKSKTRSMIPLSRVFTLFARPSAKLHKGYHFLYEVHLLGPLESFAARWNEIKVEQKENGVWVLLLWELIVKLNIVTMLRA